MGTVDELPDVKPVLPDEISTWEMRAHMRRVETLCGVMRDLLLAASQVPPFSMMVTAEQLEELRNL